MKVFDAFPPLCRCVVGLVTSLLSVAVPRIVMAQEGAPIYNIDFGSPTHTLNAVPASGATSDRVSKVVFGTPTVVQEFGPLKDRPLLFRGRAKYDQIRLDLPEGSKACRVEFDVATENLKDSDYGFAISLDTPQVRVLQFHGRSNKIYKFPSDPPMNRPWVEGEVSHFVIEADLVENRWEMWKDGVLICTAALNGTKLRAIRFSLSPVIAGASDDLSIGVAVDNIKVWKTGGGDLPGNPNPVKPSDPNDPVLYDIDFSGPAHTLDSTPTTGVASDLVSEVVFGSPTVVQEFGSLTDRPLLFSGREGYDQIRLDIKPGWSKYRVEYDVVTENLRDSDYSFGVSLDTPQVRNLHLHGGLNEVYNFPNPAISNQLWREGARSRFVIEVDLAANLWEVWQDDFQILSIPLDATNLKSVRFSLAPWIAGASNDLSVSVAVDNIKVTASNPIIIVPPAGFSVTSREQAKGMFLSWKAVTLADSYQIYRSESDDHSKAQRIGESNQLAYLDQNAKRGIRYYYWVTSRRLGFPESAPVRGSGVRGFLPVEGLSVTPGSGSVDLTWSATGGATHYTVYRATGEKFESAVAVGRTSEPGFVDLAVEAGQAYHYWVMPGNGEADYEIGFQGVGFLGSIQPDLSVKSPTGLVAGVGIANDTGTGQVLRVTSQGRRASAGEIGVSALNDASGALLLSGSGGNRQMKAFYSLKGNVTAAMVSGRLSAETGGGQQNVAVSVVRQKGGASPKSLVIPVRASSPSSATDQVVLQVRNVLKKSRKSR